METRTDEHGNEIVVVGPAAPAPVKAPKKKADMRKNDVQIATDTMTQWGKPLAYQAGQFWSYTPEGGWEVCTDALTVQCNDLRGSCTEQSVMKIIAARVRVPDLELVNQPSTYWEWVDGEWSPFKVTSSQVLFSNGVLDLSTMEFTPTQHRVVFGPRVSISFDPENGFDARCDEFEKLVEYALPDQEQREYLQDLSGLILQPHVVLRGQIVFYGVPHSGKSTLATAIATAPGGSRGQAAVSEGRLTQDKWALTMLVNKFVNVSHDSDFTAKWESFMKQYTTGSFIAEPKFGKPVTVPTTAKLISTCNEFQKLSDPTGALEKRYRVFRFENEIADTGRVEQSEMMTAAFWNEPTRRAGIIAWMLIGLTRVVERGLIEPVSLKQVKKEAFYEANEVMEFIATCIERSPGSFLNSEDLVAAVGGNIHSVGRVIPRYVEKIWGVRKTRFEGKRGYKDLKLI